MRRAFQLMVCTLLFFGLPNYIRANQGIEQFATDSLKVSLLTCSPGEEIYEYYGHTALRITDVSRKEDYVFNYGLFNYNAPNFIWRFVRGECDYEVGATFLTYFLPEYKKRGSFVREMQLNLTQAEMHRLFTALLINCNPENATYHYDFFYDNCATRVLDQIQQCIQGELLYTQPIKEQSLRDIVHQYSEPYKWSRFGQDLLLGAEADKQATRRMQQFAPLYLENDLKTAKIKRSNGQIIPLIKGIDKLVEEQAKPASKGFPLSPVVCSLLLFALTIGICIQNVWKNKLAWIFDLILLSIQGLIGCIITFMFFFSIHPTVDTNWLVILFNPIPLFFLYGTIRAERKGKPCYYYKISRYILAAFLIASPLIPQYFGATVIVLALCLLLRSICCYKVGRNLQKIKKYS